MFAATSVAVVGASANPVALGSRTLANLEASGFGGRLYAVNGKYDRLGERPCFPSVAALPETPECVVVAVPREAVEPVVIECAARGVGAVIVYASGYVETAKPGRAEQQQRLVDIGREAGMPILGPNCIGILNYAAGFHPSFVIAPPAPPLRPHGAIGLISQSGALAFSLAQAVERGVALSHVLTSGNAGDVDLADQISYLAEDDACTAIACVFEGMAQPQRLFEAAARAYRAGKPLVVYKMATGEAGAAAAMSHTGSLAGSQAAYAAAFERAGIVTVDGFETLLETASFFAKAKRPRADGVAVLAASGGSCIMAADQAERHGVPLPQPGPAAAAALHSVMPEFGTVRNPCDVTAQGFLGDGLARTLDAMMADPAYAAVVLPRVQALPDVGTSVKLYGETARRHGKIACSVWLSEWLEGPGARETEAETDVALFRSTERCFRTLAAWMARERWQQAQPRELPRLADPAAAERVAQVLAAADARLLGERETKPLLAAYGVPVVEERLVHDERQAVEAARALGFPVAMKVESPDLPHKTEAGVIRLGLADEEAVRRAHASLQEAVAKLSPAPRVTGILVQAMVPAGAEMMVGGRIDPLLGPLVVVGLGGVFVELMKDTATALAPITPAEALTLLGRLRGQSLLDGFRGAPAVNRARLADVIARLSEFIADQSASIAELDVNPLICAGNHVMAVDALLVRHPTKETS